ncbi:MAG TPA: J domain-containing protein [Bryobacteraceae bacterium]|nr:J domain-containing protein [Bryobacteraceae bacterium]
MSAPLAGKFQDHYEVLGIDPKSDSDAIQRAYSILAQRFHPSNTVTGDKEKFDSVNQAYEILSDLELRKDFDTVKGVSQEDAVPKFSGLEFFDALGRGSYLRATILSVLYDRRRTNPFKPSLSLRHMEGMLNVTAEELAFAMWYLKQRNLVLSDDKSALLITVEGMDFLESHQPPADMVLHLIKPTALAAAKAPPAAPGRFAQLGRHKPASVVA